MPVTVQLLMDSHKRSTQLERLEVVETGRRRGWSNDEKLRIVTESFEARRAIGACPGIKSFRLFSRSREKSETFGACSTPAKHDKMRHRKVDAETRENGDKFRNEYVSVMGEPNKDGRGNDYT